MSYNSGVSMAVGDRRSLPMPVAASVAQSVADALLDGGTGAQLTIASGSTFGTTATVALGARSTPTQNLALGYAEYAWTDIDLAAWFTGGVFGSADGLNLILCMDNFSDGVLEAAVRTNALLTTTRPTRCVAVAIDRALNVRLYMNENGTVNTSAVLATTTIAKHDFELKATVVAGPRLQIEARIDKVSIGTFTSPNPFVAWSIQCARCGWLDNNAIPPAGNGSADARWGNLFRSDSAGNAPTGWPLDGVPGNASGPHAEILLPNGDGALTQWITETGGVGTFTRWDEAKGTWTSGDGTYNHSGAGVGPLDQISTYPNSARTVADTLVGVSLQGQSILSVGFTWNSEQQGITSNVTASFKGVNQPDNAQGQGLLQSHWNVDPNGAIAWTFAASNALVHTARRTNADTTDEQIRTWYKVNWFYGAVTPPAIKRRRLFSLAGSLDLFGHAKRSHPFTLTDEEIGTLGD